jgi:hypothetical protein
MDNAEVGAERCKGVGGYFYVYVGKAGNQGRFAGIGHTYETNICNELQFEFYFFLFAGGPFCANIRGLVGGGFKAAIAFAALAADADFYALALFGKVVKDLFCD